MRAQVEEVARHHDCETLNRLGAMKEILDRTFGKSPQHVDIAAIKHTEIVYRSAAEIRQELLARGVPQVYWIIIKTMTSHEEATQIITS